VTRLLFTDARAIELYGSDVKDIAFAKLACNFTTRISTCHVLYNIVCQCVSIIHVTYGYWIAQ